MLSVLKDLWPDKIFCHQALGQLVPIDREIVILFHREEKSYQEISQILNLPETTIKTRLHRARLKIRELII